MLEFSSNLASLCCICGNPQCSETYDHSRITPKQLVSLLQRNRQTQPLLTDLHSRLDDYYKILTEELLKQLENDKKRVRQQLKQLEFPQLRLGKVSMELVGRLATGDFSQLPNRRVIQLVEALQAEPQTATFDGNENSLVRAIR